jgi:hypothetical protein
LSLFGVNTRTDGGRSVTVRPAVGVLVELVVFVVVLSLGTFVPAGLSLALYVVIAQLTATYLIHCPAHYLVGSALGIRFREMRIGRTALARVLPVRLAGIARLVPVLSLSTQRDSIVNVSKRRAAAMYASGTVASVSSAIAIAAVATSAEPLTYAALAWAVAVGYLLFDAVFSPRSGDLMRARISLRK